MVMVYKLPGVVRYGWVLIALGLTACADPEGRFNEFTDRYNELQVGVPQDVPCVERPACTPPAPGAIDGTYLWTISAELDPKKPVIYRAELTTSAGGTGLALSFSAIPLNGADRTTEEAAATDFGPFDVESTGCFLAPLHMTAPGPANPITGSDLVADIQLDGQICAGETAFCGLVTGAVTSPANIPLTKSTFTFDPLVGGDYPEPPVLNCVGDLANPI